MRDEDFIRESNKIEGIHRAPSHEEIAEHMSFLGRPQINIVDLERFVAVYEPGARLRDKAGLNVRVGPHLPPAGSPKIRRALQDILTHANCGDWDAFKVHCEYETLHPFTDGNGRSGRILWLWCMGGHAPLGFLHTFYYQSLQNSRS